MIAGEGMIVTAGAIDCHVHFICPQLAYEAIASGKPSISPCRTLFCPGPVLRYSMPCASS